MLIPFSRVIAYYHDNNAMFELRKPTAPAGPELYDALLADARALIGEERDMIANAANLASLVYHSLDDLNWVGFYFLKEGELVLGPFQGKPACIRIAVGRGVCGTAVAERRTIVVEDVEAFPGHIACDSASRSEIVVPIIRGDDIVGVLDLDSFRTARFDARDAAGLERLVALFAATV